MEHLWDAAQTEIFRLEALPSYENDEEAALLQEYLRTGKVTLDDNSREWLAELQLLAQRGVAVRRLRVLPAVDTDYIRFERAAYAHNISAGEQIRTISEDKMHELGLHGIGDFWLFDGGNAAVMLRYDEQGRYLGGDEADAEDAEALAAVRDVAWDAAEPLQPTAA